MNGGVLGYTQSFLPFFPPSLPPSLSPSLLGVQMKVDFQRLEDDMSQLGVKMEEITDSSDSINTALADRKGEIAKLCGVHHLLKKVQCVHTIAVSPDFPASFGSYAECSVAAKYNMYQNWKAWERGNGPFSSGGQK